ncbi:MAG: aminotransferase class I/II-fold pyridoxal phosphate-dependent enzyme [Clostridia bacterium]|nr:aminotransferase class I/II-fold pyridoxal phosphate-dependent enzyme [Clostridia bacterium]
MAFDFETVVQRRKANLKRMFTPEDIRDHGNVSFDGAEPDYATAPVIRDAVRALADNGLYGFTLMDKAYQDAVCWWLENSRGVRIDPDWIVPTLGTIHALSSAIRLLCPRVEDALLVMPPVYNRFAQAANRLNRPTVSCPLLPGEGRYAIDFDGLEAALRSANVKLMVICNPHNPIGQIWSQEELTRVARIAVKHHVVIFSDEIFADNCYGGRRCPSFLEIPEAKDQVLISTSLGKAFGLTGINHANLLIPSAALREAFADRRTRDHYGSMDPLAYECVLAGYSEAGLDWVRASNQVCDQNIHLIRETFAHLMPDSRVFGGEGAYVLWIDLRPYFDSEETMLDFLYHKAYFHVDGGSAYGMPGFIRMCVASPTWCVEKALNDLKQAWKERNNDVAD